MKIASQHGPTWDDELYTELAAFRLRPTLVGALLVLIAIFMSDSGDARLFS